MEGHTNPHAFDVNENAGHFTTTQGAESAEAQKLQNSSF